MSQWKIYALIIVSCAIVNCAILAIQKKPEPTILLPMPPTKQEHMEQRRRWEAKHMADTGWITATSITELAENPQATWTSEVNASADDGVYARCDVDEGEISSTLRFLFSLAVPSGSVPVGVEVRYEAKAEAGGVVYQGYLTSLVKSAVPVGNNKADLTTIPTTNTLYTKGGASDLWGTTLSRDEANAADFGFDLRFENISGIGFIYVDYGQIKVYYAEPTYGTADGTLPGMYGSGQGKIIGSGSAVLPGLTGKAHHRVN